MSRDSYRQRDIKHIWHPYSDIAAMESEPFPVIRRAEGIYIYDADGRKLIDGISSWWCCNLGHSHPRLVEALCNQAQRLQHSMLGGMSHPSAIDLAERLSAVCPTGLGRVLFAGDGSSAVEAALKISVQYWANLGEGQRTQFASLEDAYHGDTLGAMGVGFIPGFHEQFAGIVRQAHRASSPY
ncbi:MAG: aminotransferase class III-fold pyridoxal phosphate-dependent enzyme, partial [Phycisphaerae bacterium]|nr:aminotransferase class III-fold pyridoxal phosphate-dependent enzyme [Phycisphaerae bacterium]